MYLTDARLCCCRYEDSLGGSLDDADDGEGEMASGLGARGSGSMTAGQGHYADYVMDDGAAPSRGRGGRGNRRCSNTFARIVTQLEKMQRTDLRQVFLRSCTVLWRWHCWAWRLVN